MRGADRCADVLVRGLPERDGELRGRGLHAKIIWRRSEARDRARVDRVRPRRGRRSRGGEAGARSSRAMGIEMLARGVSEGDGRERVRAEGAAGGEELGAGAAAGAVDGRGAPQWRRRGAASAAATRQCRARRRRTQSEARTQRAASAVAEPSSCCSSPSRRGGAAQEMAAPSTVATEPARAAVTTCAGGHPPVAAARSAASAAARCLADVRRPPRAACQLATPTLERRRGEQRRGEFPLRRSAVACARALPSKPSPATLRVNVLGLARGRRFHVDTLELYSARQRAHFTKLASDELRRRGAR